MDGVGKLELFIVLFGGAIAIIAVVVPAVLICRKAGFSPWLGVLAAVPIANLLLLWYVALVPWPTGRFATRREG